MFESEIIWIRIPSILLKGRKKKSHVQEGIGLGFASHIERKLAQDFWANNEAKVCKKLLYPIKLN